MNLDAQSPRFTAERQRRITVLLQQHGRVEVLELARILQVSEHTVRRDLLALQGQGLLQRTHGGAVSLDTQRLGLGARAAVLPDAKAALGRAAAALVEPGQTVVLDSGSTPLAMARALTVRPLTIVTSSLDVAALFADDRQVEIVLTGGTWQHANRALWGPAALATLANCRADWAVPGACAIDARLGVSAPFEADAAMKRAMVACARRTLILADHSKRDHASPFHVADWSQVHLLLIDRPWPEAEAAGVPVQVAAG